MLQSSISTKRSSGLVTTLGYHLYSIYLTCSSNIWDIDLPGYLFGVLNASIAHRLSMGPPCTITHNLFMFCLHNQRQPGNIAEDALNKPWRPIPTGRFTPKHAKRMLYFMHPWCLAVGLTLGGVVPYIVLTAFHVWYNEFGGASNGILKNLLNAVGIICFFAGPLEVATGHSVLSGDGNGMMWLCILTTIFATTCHVQDFRDVDGDRAAKRQTLPLVVGDMTARIFAVIGVVGWTEIACRFWKVGWATHLGCALLGATMVGSLLADKSQKGDHRTWRLWSLWIQGLVMLPVIQG
ncbi:UbiA prenyltransferase family [Hypoxylon sp. FL1284]|nr:UbiA prenyltransferase family [Hypoxylon sp. FL1284]